MVGALEVGGHHEWPRPSLSFLASDEPDARQLMWTSPGVGLLFLGVGIALDVSAASDFREAAGMYGGVSAGRRFVGTVREWAAARHGGACRLSGTGEGFGPLVEDVEIGSVGEDPVSPPSRDFRDDAQARELFEGRVDSGV